MLHWCRSLSACMNLRVRIAKPTYLKHHGHSTAACNKQFDMVSPISKQYSLDIGITKTP